MDNPITDTPYQRTDITQLSEDQLHALIAALQSRRLRARKQFEEAEVLKHKALTDRTRKQIIDVVAMIASDLKTLDKTFDRITKRLAKIEALKRVVRMEHIEAANDESTNGT